MRKLWMYFILVLCTLGACVNQEIIDEIQLISTIGYDFVKDDVVEGSVSVPIYGPELHEGGGSVRSETISGIARTSKDLRAQLNARSRYELNSSKLAIVLYNDELAKYGIMELVDTLRRDPIIGRRVFLAVLEGKTKQLLNLDSPLEPEISQYLSDLISQNTEAQGLPTTNLHVYLYHFNAPGMDPYLPLLEQTEDQVEVKGLAILKDDKMVTTIDREEMFIFKMFVENFDNGFYEVTLSPDEYADIFNLQARSSYHVENGNQTPEITVTLDIEGRISEYSGVKLDDQKIEEIQHKAEEELQKRAKKMITQFQALEVDPIGFGDQVRSRTRKWDYENWKRKYARLDIKVETNVQVSNAGVVE
ncbi:Ger(x)C family spore germination protein [Thalassobacillus sp. C254]|uniref:Ger(x)C family spore germination protein n=1 Tax=Thalassobacillus sp. C254 TaxID=1225341 RepID=UPI0006D19488|nr:Ger(x)C family spore germination protein [Thalassobacillus sp. C254]